MALRSLGSSLVAKASPGSATRRTQETRIAKPEVPGKGAPGSTGRELLDEPFLRQIPPGSERVVRVAPGAEAVSQQSPAPIPEMAGVIGQVPAGQVRSQSAPGNPNQALFEGGVSPAPAAAPTSGGKVARSVSGAGQASAPIRKAGDVMGIQTEAQNSPTVNREGFLPTAFSAVSGRTSAGGGDQPTIESRGMGSTGVERSGNNISFTPTAGQLLAGGVGKVLTNVGTKLNAPQIIPGGLGAQLQKFGGAVQPAIAGIGSISSGLRSVTQSAKNTVNNLRSQASNFLNKLFRR